MVVKRIMRYLKGTKDFGLYQKKNEKFEVRAYTDVDWARNIDDRKLTSRGAFFLGKRFGLARNKIKYLNLLLKLNIWLLQ